MESEVLVKTNHIQICYYKSPVDFHHQNLVVKYSEFPLVCL